MREAYERLAARRPRPLAARSTPRDPPDEVHADVLAAVEARAQRGARVSVPLLPGTEDHPHARMVLGGRARAGAPSHAYLFHGPAGTGKRTAARAFAAELLAEGADDPDAVAPARRSTARIPT